MKRTFSIIGQVIVWILLVVAIVFIVLTLTQKQNDGIPHVFGYSMVNVLSDSMKGTAKDDFQTGDLLFVKTLNDTQKEALQVGDIITFRSIVNGQQSFVTHRIAAVHNNNGTITFTTKGDNNSVADADDKAVSDVVGQYTGDKLAGWGNVMSFIQSKWGFFSCLIIPLVLFFVWQLIRLILAVRTYRKIGDTDEDDDTTSTAPLLTAETAELKASAASQDNAESVVVNESSGGAETDSKDE